MWQEQLTGEGGERVQFTGENSACIIFTNRKNVTEFLVVSDCVTFILHNNPTLNNYFYFCK